MKIFATATLIALLSCPALVTADTPDEAVGVIAADHRDVSIGSWLIGQAMPSIALTHGDHGTSWGLGWELRPLIVPFGQGPRLFYAEPAARHSGSFEVFSTTEYYHLDMQRFERWVFRAGGRVHLPLVSFGRPTSFSIGAAYYNGLGTQGISYEVGLHLLSGMIETKLAFVAHSTTPQYVWSFAFRAF